jgi:hypothetical protein
MMWPMHHHCSPPAPGCCIPQPVWYCYPVACVPVHCAPPAQECCEEERECEELTVPQQIDATGGETPSAVLVGGHDNAHLTLEYLVETGATDPKVTVTAVQPDGATATWTDTGIAVGFHVQEKFLTVKPGTKVKLEVSSVTARLHWCETICC